MILNKKGVSPLIATVLLIAVTMAIAGVMATWATTFTAGKVEEANVGADCIGAIDISSLAFSNTTVTLKIRNVAERINLTNIKASIEYGDFTKNKQLNVVDYNVTDPLPPASTTWLVYNTASTTKPSKIEILASNCVKYPATLFFR
ncbi:MAG TPA: archaellin/type IV pilin N-terminal domain-containing protein [archaeon]|nr:archaellin/type IV pilin N-terminal domain-containing protein [archaeon]